MLVPDTLDLAQRADLALNCLTGALDPEHDYELYFVAQFGRKPAVMFHESTGLPTNNPKFAEAQPMMRVMSGNDRALDVQHAMMTAMLRNVHEDGLYYSPTERRPWSHEGGLSVGGEAPRPFANVYGNARFLLAMMAWAQWEPEPAWEGRMRRLADALVRIAIDKGDYAYYPVGCGVGEMFSYTPGGWTETAEPTEGGFGVPMYYSGVIRALAGWYDMTGDRGALRMAGKLAAYLRRPFVWAPEPRNAAVDGPEHGHCAGHFHAHAAALRGLLAYAISAQEEDLVQFVRDGYEWLRTYGVARIGWFPENLKAGQHCETCCTADMVALAIRLSDAGAGDCWDDADRFTRNQLVEQQIIRADYLQRLSDASQAKPVDAPRETADHVIERNIGGFAGHGDLSELPDTWIMHCCTGNGANALYYAWEGALRVVAGTATVNLLLNRASQDLDVHSHLPYEGRVELRNKSARRVLVRVPPGVERGHVECRIGARRVEPVVVGRYVLVDGMKGGEHVEVRFPLAEHRERLVLEGREHSAVMRGNTMVSISPRASGIGYPIYERDFLCDGRAPVRHASPYVPRRVLAWV